MSESSAESASSSVSWEVARYVVVTVVACVLIWYYFFYTPPVYVDQEYIGETMGTNYTVKVAQFPETGDWSKIVADIQSKLDDIDQKMSTYKDNSEVCRFNASTSTEDWFHVSQETAFLVQTSLAISRLSEGAFDITAGPLVRHWGFGAGSEPWTIKSYDELKSEAILLKEKIGYEKLSVRPDSPALKKAIPELSIDLSGIAKGYAVDCIANMLDERKITNYLIEVGDELRIKGRKSKDKEWIVGVEKPTPEFKKAQQIVPLKNQSMATSGNYLQTIQLDNQRVSHIVDPRSGLPAQIGSGSSEFASVSVIASDCTQADAWATALFVLGEQEGIGLADRQGLAVLYLLQRGNEIVEIPSKKWGK